MFSAAQASALSKNLGSGTDTGLRAAIAVPTGDHLDPLAARKFAALAPIVLDAASFHRLGRDDGTVTGHVGHPSAGLPTTWTFTVLRVAGVWKISDAAPIR